MKIFDLEQSIMKCWNITDDIDYVLQYILEGSDSNKIPPKVQDTLANILIGMKDLYNLKFNECFTQFEDICGEYHKNRKLVESMKREDISDDNC